MEGKWSAGQLLIMIHSLSCTEYLAEVPWPNFRSDKETDKILAEDRSGTPTSNSIRGVGLISGFSCLRHLLFGLRPCQPVW